MDEFGFERLQPPDRVDRRPLQVGIGFNVRPARRFGSEFRVVPDNLRSDDDSSSAAVDENRLVPGGVPGGCEDRNTLGDLFIAADHPLL